MKTKMLLTTLPRWVLLLFASLWLAACNAPAPGGTVIASGSGVRVWLDQPPTGVGLPLAPFALKAHARDTVGGGVQKIVFLVNTIPLGEINTDSTQPLVYGEFGWNPSMAGEYSIQAQAFNATGSALSEIAIVCVGPDCTQDTAPVSITPQPFAIDPTPQILVSPSVTRAPIVTPPTPTATRNVPSVTPSRTSVPPTRTSTPIPQTGCSGTPNIASFSASPATITAGGSSVLSWGAVTNADSVSMDQGIGGVPAPGSRTVSPGGTTIYTLTARCGNNAATKQATVTLTGAPPPLPPPPQDTTPPAISGVKPNSSNLTYPSACSYPNTLTVAASVTDPSGVASVQLYYRYVPSKGTASSWNAITMSPSGGGSYSGTVNVGSQAYTPLGGGNGNVEFYVNARDNIGNSGNSSTSSVTIQYCPS